MRSAQAHVCALVARPSKPTERAAERSIVPDVSALSFAKNESRSASASARILYHYRNEPRIGEADLKSHRGFAEILFKPDLSGGSGEYFNGQGRFTFGRMHLIRRTNG